MLDGYTILQNVFVKHYAPKDKVKEKSIFRIIKVTVKVTTILMSFERASIATYLLDMKYLSLMA